MQKKNDKEKKIEMPCVIFSINLQHISVNTVVMGTSVEKNCTHYAQCHNCQFMGSKLTAMKIPLDQSAAP